MTSLIPPYHPTSPDWLRLQKALSVEADRRFNDLEGKQYRFSEFFSFTLNQPPVEIPSPGAAPLERSRRPVHQLLRTRLCPAPAS